MTESLAFRVAGHRSDTLPVLHWRGHQCNVGDYQKPASAGAMLCLQASHAPRNVALGRAHPAKVTTEITEKTPRFGQKLLKSFTCPSNHNLLFPVDQLSIDRPLSN